MKQLVVIGGGISGLAAAHTAAKGKPEDVRILVLEKDPEPGGKARTRRLGPWSVETGPAAYLSGEKELDKLVARAAQLNQVEGQNVFIGLALRKRTADRSKRSADTDFQAGIAGWGDFDDTAAVRKLA